VRPTRTDRRGTPSRPAPTLRAARVRFRLHLDGLDRYHGPAALVAAAGGLGMIVCLFRGLGPPWAGWLAGAVPVMALFALVLPEPARR
jgi:hypothetical protein